MEEKFITIKGFLKNKEKKDNAIFVAKTAKSIIIGPYTANNFKYDDALELADMIFDNELDRYYFLKQLYKLYNLDEKDLNREMSKVLKLTRL